MRYLSSLGLGRRQFGAAEHRPMLMAWLAVVAGIAICTIATLLL
jgi:hypothetical protein